MATEWLILVVASIISTRGSTTTQCTAPPARQYAQGSANNDIRKHPTEFYRGNPTRCSTPVIHARSSLWDAWGIQGKVCGSAECSGNGWMIGGVAPYCECFEGWTGSMCQTRQEVKGVSRGCIVYYAVLAPNDRVRILDWMKESFQTLEKYFLKKFSGYRLMLFNNMTDADVNSVKSEIKSARFYDVKVPQDEIEIPPRLKKFLPATCVAHADNIPYISMCRWFDYHFYRQKILSDKCDYVWRIDTDIFLKSPAECDVFSAMKLSRALFATSDWSANEWHECMGPIWEFSYNYSKSICAPPYHLNLAGGSNALAFTKYYHTPAIYWGFSNFFKWSFFTSVSFLHYIDAFDEYGFVTKHRLGEQGMYTHALAVLIPKEAIRLIQGFDFSHKHMVEVKGRHDPLCAAVRKAADDEAAGLSDEAVVEETGSRLRSTRTTRTTRVRLPSARSLQYQDLGQRRRRVSGVKPNELEGVDPNLDDDDRKI